MGVSRPTELPAREVRSDPLLEFHSIPRNNTRHCHSQRFVLTSVCVSDVELGGGKASDQLLYQFLPSQQCVGG